jgi:hypothetical protein
MTFNLASLALAVALAAPPETALPFAVGTADAVANGGVMAASLR